MLNSYFARCHAWTVNIVSLSNLYKELGTTIHFDRCFSGEKNLMMIAIPSMEEIECVMRSMNKWRVPMVIDELLSAIRRFFTTRRILTQWNHAIFFQSLKSKDLNMFPTSYLFVCGTVFTKWFRNFSQIGWNWYLGNASSGTKCLHSTET